MGSKRRNGMVYSTNPELMRQLIEAEQGAPITTLDPADQRLVLRRDAKMRKGKVVTLVEGFEGTDEDLQELGKRLRNGCGVGGSAKEGVIIVQGDAIERVHKLLSDWGYTRTRVK